MTRKTSGEFFCEFVFGILRDRFWILYPLSCSAVAVTILLSGPLCAAYLPWSVAPPLAWLVPLFLCGLADACLVWVWFTRRLDGDQGYRQVVLVHAMFAALLTLAGLFSGAIAQAMVLRPTEEHGVATRDRVRDKAMREVALPLVVVLSLSLIVVFFGVSAVLKVVQPTVAAAS
jgi:hypothetical protein